MRSRLLLLAFLAGAAPLLASCQGGMYCMSGVPCGNGCTMGDGLCIQGQCYDRTGTILWECMAPMTAPAPLRLQGYAGGSSSSSSSPADPNPAAAAGQATSSTSTGGADAPLLPQQPQPALFYPSAWGPHWSASSGFGFSFPPFPSFPSFRGPRWMPLWSPMPMMPPMPMMGQAGQWGLLSSDCGGKGPCGAGQFCDTTQTCRPDDCVSQFKYGCAEDKGELQKVACPHFSGFKECYVSSSGGFKCFKGPSGASLACASQSGGGAGGGAVFTMTGGFQSDLADLTTPGSQDAAAKTSASGDVAADADATASSASSATAAGPGPKSAYKKVVTESGAASPRAATAAVASSSSAAWDAEGQWGGAKAVFLADAATQAPGGKWAGSPQALISPDGSVTMAVAAGPGQAGPVGGVNVARDGSGMAAGMASGDYKSVATRTGPGGMTESSSVSQSVSGTGQPAIASAVASSGPPGPMTMLPDGQQQQLQLPNQQGTAASSRDGTAAPRDLDASAAAKAVPPAKSSAGTSTSAVARVMRAGAVACVSTALLLLL